ncbi:MAG: redoxin family protein [Actinobacteria bacterium]|uniref:Unannotated protein n=1 Tax=freshwater metagenome TaxID=449393 RepID=A0A6J7D6S7_9ZZZZ|nr:TlpA disulfide reductase family protein [Actinomycetota bacterium]MSW47342.1 redoxin family protein [Actinomycetota bacterium]MSX24801.1 redoxin family protein [Actinomycetota bacterium]MSY46207.1 redoxin family protein [Actinomycetota bacterium]MSY56791.1 redoxin family protein [Actinomycetota bacterium]
MILTSKLSVLSIAAILLLVGCGGGSSTDGAESFIAGNGTVTFLKAETRFPAPAISGEGIDGNMIRAQEGKIKVINVWASWCAPCRAEAPTLQALSKKYSDVSFVGILTRDNVATAKAFIKRFEITYPTLVDDRILLDFHDSLLANAIPSTLLVDKKGRVAARISGEITVASLTDLIDRLVAE